MVSESKAQARKAIAERIAAAFDSGQDIPKAPKLRSWIKAQFGVSTETARKWLEGEATPEATHMAMIGAKTNVRPDYLWTGLGPQFIDAAMDEDFAELRSVWAELRDEDEVRSRILQYANLELRNLSPKPPPSDPFRRAETGRVRTASATYSGRARASRKR